MVFLAKKGQKELKNSVLGGKNSLKWVKNGCFWAKDVIKIEFICR